MGFDRFLKGALILAVAACVGCGSNLKMQYGFPVEARRGYVIDRTRFYQGGKQVNRDDARTKLQRNEEAAGYIQRGRVFETLSDVFGVAGAALIILATPGGIDLGNEDEIRTEMLLTSGGLAVLSIVGALLAEHNYVEGVERYNGDDGDEPSSSSSRLHATVASSASATVPRASETNTKLAADTQRPSDTDTKPAGFWLPQSFYLRAQGCPRSSCR